MNGVITGGWGYVGAAYGFTAVALFGYLGSVVLRLRAEARLRASEEAATRAEGRSQAAAASPAGAAGVVS